MDNAIQAIAAGMNRTITRDKVDPTIAIVTWRNTERYFKERIHGAEKFLNAIEEAGLLGMEMYWREEEVVPEPEPEAVIESDDDLSDEIEHLFALPTTADELTAMGFPEPDQIYAFDGNEGAMVELTQPTVTEAVLTDDLSDIGNVDDVDDEGDTIEFTPYVPIFEMTPANPVDEAPISDDLSDIGNVDDVDSDWDEPEVTITEPTPEPVIAVAADGTEPMDFDISDLEADADEDADMIDPFTANDTDDNE